MLLRSVELGPQRENVSGEWKLVDTWRGMIGLCTSRVGTRSPLGGFRFAVKESGKNLDNDCVPLFVDIVALPSAF